MHILRRLAVILAIAASGFLLVAFLWLLAVRLTFLDSSTVKTWLRQSDIYNNLGTKLVDAAATQPNAPAISDDLKESASKILPPAYVQQIVESQIDNIYGWANGASTDIKLDLPTTDELKSQIGANLEATLSKLPTCTGAEGEDTELCLPSGTSPADMTQNLFDSYDQARSQIANNAATINPTSLGVADTNQAVTQIGSIPAYVDWLNRSLIVLPVMAAIFGLGAILIAEQKLVATIKLSRRLFFASLGVVFTALLIMLATRYLTDIDFGTGQGAVYAATIVPVAQQILRGFGLELIIVGTGSAVIFLICWITLHIIRSKRTVKPQTSETEQPKEAPEAPQAPTTPPANQPSAQ